jgi:hypothetical protein
VPVGRAREAGMFGNASKTDNLEDIEKRRNKNLPRPSKRENVIIF